MNHLAVRNARPIRATQFHSNLSLNGLGDSLGSWEDEWEDEMEMGVVAMSNRDRKVPAKLSQSRSGPRRMEAWN